MQAKIWFPILIIVFFLGAFTANAWLVALTVVIAVFIGVALYWNNHSLDNITYKRRWHYRRGFPKEQTEIRLEVENRKILPISWLKISDIWPKGAAPNDGHTLRSSHLQGFGRLINLYSLKWFEKITRKYTLEFKQRGVYQVGPTEITSGDLFGLYEKKREDINKEYITVFPELLPLHPFDLDNENPMGDHRSRKRLFEDPNRPMGVRSYRPEDEFRRIHWPATARTGELQVKVYQPVNSKVMVVCLNIATSVQSWIGVNQPLSEHLISLAGTLCYKNILDGYAVGLLSNSCLSHSDQPFIIQPSRSPKQLAHLLESLARITLFVTAPFEVFLSRALPKLPFGASLVIATALVTPGLCETLIRIKRFRSNITLISLEQSPPPKLPGINAIHLPFQIQMEGEK